MIDIILNEKKKAEEILKNKTFQDKPNNVVFLLSKYYYSIGYKKKKIIELVTKFISDNYSRYLCNKSSWDDYIESIASKIKKYKLYEINGVYITIAELDAIKQLKNKDKLESSDPNV